MTHTADVVTLVLVQVNIIPLHHILSTQFLNTHLLLARASLLYTVHCNTLMELSTLKLVSSLHNDKYTVETEYKDRQRAIVCYYCNTNTI